MFFPFKLDVIFHKIPFLTIGLILLCTYLHFTRSTESIKGLVKITQFCMYNPKFYEELKKYSKVRPELFPNYKLDNKGCTNDLMLMTSQGMLRDEIESDISLSEDERAFLLESYDDYDREVGDIMGYENAIFTKKFSIKRILTASLLHKDFSHLVTNMYFLWIFGSAVELCLGSGLFVLFVFCCSLFTGIFFHLVTYEAIFSLGSSGFIFGLMGLFLTLCWSVKVKTLFMIWTQPHIVDIPSWVMIGFLFLRELYLLLSGASGEVNFVSHLAGASLGVLLGLTMFKKYKFS